MRANTNARVSIFGISGLGQDDDTSPIDIGDGGNDTSITGGAIVPAGTIYGPTTPSGLQPYNTVSAPLNTTNGTTATSSTAPSLTSAISSISSAFSSIFKAIQPIPNGCSQVTTAYGTSTQCNSPASAASLLSSLGGSSSTTYLLLGGAALVVILMISKK